MLREEGMSGRGRAAVAWRYGRRGPVAWDMAVGPVLATLGSRSSFTRRC